MRQVKTTINIDKYLEISGIWFTTNHTLHILDFIVLSFRLAGTYPIGDLHSDKHTNQPQPRKPHS
jgi:hypothetical protein